MHQDCLPHAVSAGHYVRASPCRRYAGGRRGALVRRGHEARIHRRAPHTSPSAIHGTGLGREVDREVGHIETMDTIDSQTRILRKTYGAARLCVLNRTVFPHEGGVFVAEHSMPASLEDVALNCDLNLSCPMQANCLTSYANRVAMHLSRGQWMPTIRGSGCLVRADGSPQRCEGRCERARGRGRGAVGRLTGRSVGALVVTVDQVLVEDIWVRDRFHATLSTMRPETHRTLYRMASVIHSHQQILQHGDAAARASVRPVMMGGLRIGAGDPADFGHLALHQHAHAAGAHEPSESDEEHAV